MRVNDFVQIKYAAPVTTPCVSGNDIASVPGDRGNYAGATIYQVTAVDATTGFPTVVSTAIANVAVFARRLAARPGCD